MDRFLLSTLITIALSVFSSTELISAPNSGPIITPKYPTEAEMTAIKAEGVIRWKDGFTYNNVSTGAISTQQGKHYYFTDNGHYVGGAYGVYIPTSYDGSTPMPIVFASHGSGIMGPREIDNWTTLADNLGFIVVSPSYIVATNNHNLGPGTSQNLADERVMTAEIMDKLLESDLNIDETRVLGTGFSGGSFPTYLMMMELPQYFTATCIRSGNYFAYPLNIDSDYWKQQPIYIFWSDNDAGGAGGVAAQGRNLMYALLNPMGYFDSWNDVFTADGRDWKSENNKIEWKLNSIGHNHAASITANWFMSLDFGSNPSPTVEITAPIGCNNQPTLNANVTDLSAGETVVSYVWYKDGILLNGGISGSITATADGDYKVVVTTSKSNIVDDDISFDYNPFPIVEISAPAEECTVTRPILTATVANLESIVGGGETISYQWYLDNIEQVGEINSNITVTKDGEYKVIATTNTLCSGVQTLVFDNKAEPDIIILSSVENCSETQPILTAEVLNRAYIEGDQGETITYQWSYAGNGFDDLLNETNASLAITSGGEYKVTVTTSGGCVSESFISVSYTQKPNAIISNSSNEVNCQGEDVVLTSISENIDNATYQWFLDNNQINGANAKSYSVSSAGIYTLKVTNDGECYDVSDPINIEFTSTPFVDLGRDIDNLPQNSTLTLDIASNTGYAFEWAKDGNPIAGIIIPTIDITESGLYSLTATNDGLCSYTSEVEVKFNTTPEDLLSETLELTQGESGVLRVLSNHDLYKWSTGETNQQIEINADDYGIGEHIIWVEVSDDISSFAKRKGSTAVVSIRDEVKLVVSKALDNGNNLLGDKIKLSPVPVKDILNIELPKGRQDVINVKLISSTGQVVVNNNYQDSNKIKLNLSTVSPGVYSLLVEIDGKVYYDMIFKK